MSHLKLETLARLVDEAASPDEERHLAECESCRVELEALREQTELLGTLPKMLPPPDAWPELRRRLGEEGLIRASGRRWRDTAALGRAVAAVVVFVAGGAAGWGLRGPEAAGPVPGPGLAQEPARTTAEPMAAPVQAPPPTTGLAAADPSAGGEAFASALDRYMRASAAPAPDPAARLAALENIVLTTAEALNASPADPVINSYHLTAVAQRNELLRQLAASAGEPVF